MKRPTPRENWRDAPHPDRYAPSAPGFAEAMRAHTDACIEGSPGYLDPRTGLFVLTARYLHERGTCCNTGCRHCPWVGQDD